jgi:hypothetical protein
MSISAEICVRNSSAELTTYKTGFAILYRSGMMSVKSWPIEPLTYTLIIAILFAYRLARSLIHGQGQGKLNRMSLPGYTGPTGVASSIRPLSRR